MTICRFYLQGKCRFGDRCRFEHQDPQEYGYEEQTRGNNYYQPSNSSYYSPHERYNQNYSTNNRYTENRYEVLDRYDYYSTSDYHKPSRSFAEDDDYDTYNSNNYYSKQPKHYDNKYNRNRHEWVSDDYRRQHESRPQHGGHGSSFSSSTPQSKTSFSFKDSGHTARNELPTDLRMNEKNLVFAQMMKDDATAWELGKMWPFSCYSPMQNQSSFPWFSDVSPEELRYEAYKATENNSYDAHVARVKQVLQNVESKREMLKDPSVKLMCLIEKMRDGEDLTSEFDSGGALSLLSFNPAASEEMFSEEAPLQQVKTAAAAFSFKMSETDSAPANTASNFSFKTTSTAESKPPSQGINSEIYTQLENMSIQDKEQFSALTFTLGKIPTVPPSQGMCF